MAFAYPSDRRILPPHPYFDPRFGVFPHPLPPAPPSAAGFVSFPFGAVGNPCYSNPVLVPGNPNVIVALDHDALIRIDKQRTESLIEFIASEGLEPSPEEEAKRRHVIEELKQIVMTWISLVAQNQFPKEEIASASATVLTYGSYDLGVHGPESDIDALCVVPYFATLDDFFGGLCGMLRSRQEVSDIHCIRTAKIPLMRFKFNGISVDFPFAQLNSFSVPDDVDLFDPYLSVAAEISRRSLSGVRANKRILQLVPNLKSFQSMLRCVKLWAKRRGIYSHLFGFFGGIHLAILAAFICQRYPNASISALIFNFFKDFSTWNWPQPVSLVGQCRFMPPKHLDGRPHMPIMMPCTPFERCISNVTKSTFAKIKDEFCLGYSIVQDLERLDCDWNKLFKPFPYTERYTSFLRIFLAAPDDNKLWDWVGWVKSRFPGLLRKLENVRASYDPNPTEYVDHNVAEPNVVFYWGLWPNRSRFLDIDAVKGHFLMTINKDQYSDCVIDLSIIQSSELPKNLQLESGGVKESNPRRRTIDYNQLQALYSQHLPQYVLNYAASGRDYRSAVG